jgi:hypothetical protein
VLLGATNSWFPITLSVLAIPIAGDPVVQVVTDGWKYFEDVESEAETGVVLKTLKKGSTLPGVQVCEPGPTWEVIQAKRDGTLSQSALSEEDLKRPEWDVLTSPSPPSGWPEFLSRKVDTPKSESAHRLHPCGSARRRHRRGRTTTHGGSVQRESRMGASL